MAKKAKKSQKKTHIALVVDKSGSMGSIHAQALTGLNEVLSGLMRDANLGGETDVTVVLFDDRVDTVLENVPADMLFQFEAPDYVPSGMTALYDALKTAVEAITDENETDDTAYLVTVISDGFENASRMISQEQISNMIKDLEKKGNWTFAFMLANQDIHQFVKTMGVSSGNVAAFSSTAQGMITGSYVMTAGNSSYLSARSAGYTNLTSTYSSGQTA